ncbi:hypothetical protein MASR2M8_14260 [Opitutaceae bacterium]
MWLAESDGRLQLSAALAFGLLLLTAICPHAPRRGCRWNHPVLFAVLMLLAFVAFRWPGIALDEELGNPDESQLLAGALTVVHSGRPVAWVDAGTAGPLDILPLTLPALVDMPINYTTGRAVALLLLWAALILTWLALSRLFGDPPARILILPMITVIGLTDYWDFVQYSSEQALLLYLALALWLLVGAIDAKRPAQHARLALVGITCALLPLAKMQIAPLALATGLAGVVAVVLRPDPWNVRLRALGWLIGGALAAALFTLILLGASGVLRDFYLSYFASNLAYAQERDYPWSISGEMIVDLAVRSNGFAHYLYGQLILIALALPFYRRMSQRNRWWAGFSGILCVLAFVAVAAAGRGSQHYLLILILPLSWHVGVLYGAFYRQTSGAARTAGLLALVTFGVGPQVVFRWDKPNGFRQAFLAAHTEPHIDPVASKVALYTQEGDTLAIWGWTPRVYVQTQLPQASREAATARQFSTGPLQKYYRERYFADFLESRPAVFLDSVGGKNFGFNDRNTHGFENHPALNEHIERAYTYATEIQGTRVFVRNDRWTERSGHSADLTDASGQSMLQLEIDFKADRDTSVQLFWDAGAGLNAGDSSWRDYRTSENLQKLVFPLPSSPIKALRLDPLASQGWAELHGIRVVDQYGQVLASIPFSELTAVRDIASIDPTSERVRIVTFPDSRDAILQFESSTAALISELIASHASRQQAGVPEP